MYSLNWNVVIDLLSILVAGLLGVFGLVAFAMRPGVRTRALPRGTRCVTQADLDEAHERAWIEDVAQKHLRMAGGAR